MGWKCPHYILGKISYYYTKNSCGKREINHLLKCHTEDENHNNGFTEILNRLLKLKINITIAAPLSSKFITIGLLYLIQKVK